MQIQETGNWIRRKQNLIWFGSKASLKKTVSSWLNLYIGFSDVIKSVGIVQDLGVFLDAELNIQSACKDRRP